MSDPNLQGGFKGSYEQYSEYCVMHCIKDGETPTEWMNRIWERLNYFRSIKYYVYSEEECFYATKVAKDNLAQNKFSPYCGIAICFSCNQLVYTGICYMEEGEKCVYYNAG